MLERIAEIIRKHKGSLELLVLPAIVVLVGLSAFGLGRLSVMGSSAERLIIRMPDGTTQTAAAASVPAPSDSIETGAQTGAGKYIASKSGTKYYLPTCSGASRIKEENKVYFNTVAEAEAAGYTPAANCPGL